MLEPQAMESIIEEAFRRISSGGTHSLAGLVTEDVHLEGAYSPHYLQGRDTVATMFTTALPRVLNPFEQWPTHIYALGDERVAAVEYASRGTATRDGQPYENRYAGVIRFTESGLISWWREYFDPRPFNTAVGPEYAAILDEVLPAGGRRAKE